MLRRDLSLGVLATVVAGASLKRAEAQTCTLPCFPPTAAETACGFNSSNMLLQYPYGNVLRYGIVANNNSPAVANNNTKNFVALVSASMVNGPSGQIYFPNTGAGTSTPDIYYFDASAPAQLRDGIDLDLGGCQLNYSGTFETSMSYFGFLTVVRNVTIRNGSIVVNYNGTGGTNNGSAIRIGSRSSYPWGTYTAGVFDSDDLAAQNKPLQGNIRLENLRIQSNNVNAHIILALGGLRAVTLENVWLDGQGKVPFNGFYYEFGWASANGQPGNQAAWTSSHATNLVFKNIQINNMATGVSSVAFGMRGAYNCDINGMYINTADQAIDISPGEAFYYRPWNQDAVTPARNFNLRNIQVLNTPFAGALVGSAAVSGYLTSTINALPTPQRWQAQTDFLNIYIDGFSVAGCATGFEVAGGEVVLRNGVLTGSTAASSAGVLVSTECMHFALENVQVLNFNGIGVRFGFTPAIWSPNRPQWISVRNCKICGNTSGIALSLTQGGVIENNQIGFNALYDVARESTQAAGILFGATTSGIRCVNNYVTTSGGTNAYVSSNSSNNAQNFVQSERNLPTSFSGSGSFITDLMTPSAQAITTGGTIAIANFSTIRLAPAAIATGVIMPMGILQGQSLSIINESTVEIVFAAASTSHVADGTSAFIPGLAQMTFVWNTATSRWYH